MVIAKQKYLVKDFFKFNPDFKILGYLGPDGTRKESDKLYKKYNRGRTATEEQLEGFFKEGIDEINDLLEKEISFYKNYSNEDYIVYVSSSDRCLLTSKDGKPLFMTSNYEIGNTRITKDVLIIPGSDGVVTVHIPTFKETNR